MWLQNSSSPVIQSREDKQLFSMPHQISMHFSSKLGHHTLPSYEHKCLFTLRYTQRDATPWWHLQARTASSFPLEIIYSIPCPQLRNPEVRIILDIASKRRLTWELPRREHPLSFSRLHLLGGVSCTPVPEA